MSDGETEANLATGVRFVIRARPVPEPAPKAKHAAEDAETDSPVPSRWLDPVDEGDLEEQRTVQVFVDAEDLPELVAGLGKVFQASDHWRRRGGFQGAEWVFAWDDVLVFGLMVRGGREAAFLESRTMSRYFRIPVEDLGSLHRWLTEAMAGLR